MAPINITGFSAALIKDLMAGSNEPNTKQFYLTDADGDPTNIFTAQSVAIAGAKCLEQVLAYTTVSGTKVLQKRAWRDATWSGSTWDIEA